MLREIELQNAWASVMNGTCLPCPITTEGMIIITSDLFPKNYYVSAGKGVNVYPEDRPPADCTKFQLDAATDAYIPNQYLKDVEIGMPGFFSALADELPLRLQRDDIAEKVLKELWENGPVPAIVSKVEAVCKELGQQQPRDLNQVFEWLYERPNLAQRGVNPYCFTIEYDGKSYRTGPGSYYQTGIVGCAEYKGLKLKIELGNPRVLESAIPEIASVASCLFPYDQWWKEQFEREAAGGKPDIVPDPSVYLVAGSGHTLKDGQVTNEVIQFQGGSMSTSNPLDEFWTLSEDKVKRTYAPLDSLLGAITISDGMHNYVFDGDEFVEAGNKIDGVTSTNGKVTITVARDKLSTFLAHIGDIRCLWDIKSIL